MNLLPPRVTGPLSECNRSVVVCNCIPGATVTLIASRAGTDRKIGHKAVSGTKDTIPLDAGAELVEFDTVNASQELSGDQSANSVDGPSVEKSIASFSAVSVLTHLYQCSRGFSVGGMRPGTHLQLLQGGAEIGGGDAVDGTAFVTVPNGLPGPSVTLVGRQQICPKPPGAPGTVMYIVDTTLPAILPFPYHSGQTVPAPTIVQGLTACSRAVEVSGIVPGAEISLEGNDGGWWAWLGASDRTDQWVPLPVKLRDGEKVTIHQEVGMQCELKFERKTANVGPQATLGKPNLAQINCNTTPSIYVLLLKPGADVEFSVTPPGGVETLYRTAAMETDGPLPAPPMPVNSVVKVRQGECDIWSLWSDPQTAHAMAAPPSKPKISHKVYSCQSSIPVENISPLNGFLRVVSANRLELNRVPASANQMVIPFAPSITAPDDIWVEHYVCGFMRQSDKQPVQGSQDLRPASVKGPLFDGDPSVVVSNVTAGAQVEIWEATKNRLLVSGTAFGDSDTFDVSFSGFGQLSGGWSVYAKLALCGQYRQTGSVPVGFRAPVISSLSRSNIIVGSPGFTLVVNGDFYRTGSVVQWNGVGRTTTLVSAKELHVAIAAADLATPKSIPVLVVNPDGQKSGTSFFTVMSKPAPEPPGFETLLIQNCNTNYIPDSSVHRDIHIYFRRVENPRGPWIEIHDSPHNADYSASGTCPSSSSAGAEFTLDDGITFEFLCTDWYLTGCDGDTNTIACQRFPIFQVKGKTGGGTKAVIVP